MSMVLVYIFMAVSFVNCLYYLLFIKFSFAKSIQKKETTTYPVSILICAKNEAENLKVHIPLWLAQEYSNFELILINDSSYDDTLDIMESFAKQDERIKIVNVENIEAFWGNKKYALTLGIKAASNKRMLFSDADCQPASSNWIGEMASHFSEKKQIVLGFGSYHKAPGLLNRVIRFETLMTAIQYFSYAKAGTPYMGVGRNLGYTSNLYYDSNGFMSHMQIPSGDDDLFVNEAANKENTSICFSKDSFTYSIPKKTWKEWFIQKKRHITTSRLYQWKHQFLLGNYFLFQLLFWALIPVLFIMTDWKLPAVIIGLRFLFQWIAIGKGALKLGQKDLLFLLPFWEILLILFQFSIFISNSVSKPTKWK